MSRPAVQWLGSLALRVVMAASGVFTCLLLLLSTGLDQQGGLQLVRATRLPWGVWAVLFLAYSGFVLAARLNARAFGFMLGFVLFGFFGLAALTAPLTEPPTRRIPIVLIGGVALIDVALFHVAALRVALAQWSGRGGR